MSFIFKGISSTNYFDVGRIQRSLLPPITRNTQQIPGRPGEIPISTQLGMRKFTVPIRVKKDKIEDLDTAIRTISGWLYSDTPQEFILAKEPNLYYMAYLEGETDLEEIVTVGKGTLNFIAPDPIAFDRTETLLPLVSEVNQLSIVGTAKTFPRLTFTFNRDVTFFSYQGPGEKDVVIMGRPVEDDSQAAAPKQELIFDDDMESLTGNGWSEGGTIVDGGVVSGSFIASNTTFTYNDIGTGPDWHGPAVKKGLSEPLENWKVECWLKFDLTKDPKMEGRLELYFMDSAGAVIGKMAIKDMYKDTVNTMAEFRAGDVNKGQYIIRSYGARPGVYNDFWGLLSMKQEDRFFECYITKIVDGKHTTRMFKRWYDVKDLWHNKNLAQIQLHLGGVGTQPIATNDRINFDRLKVWKINKLTEPEQVPVIARAGDVIEIDHYSKSVLLNGEPRKDLLDPISKLFPVEGDSAITLYPSDAATVDLSYRSRWL